MTNWLQTRRLCVFILALGLFTMAVRGMTDPDVWWHLRTGQLIVRNHSVFKLILIRSLASASAG